MEITAGASSLTACGVEGGECSIIHSLVPPGFGAGMTNHLSSAPLSNKVQADE